MEMDFVWIALGLAAFGHFLGEGLGNFKNHSSKSILEALDSDDSHELLNETIYYPKESLRKWLLEQGKQNKGA